MTSSSQDQVGVLHSRFGIFGNGTHLINECMYLSCNLSWWMHHLLQSQSADSSLAQECPIEKPQDCSGIHQCVALALGEPIHLRGHTRGLTKFMNNLHTIHTQYFIYTAISSQVTIQSSGFCPKLRFIFNPFRFTKQRLRFLEARSRILDHFML